MLYGQLEEAHEVALLRQSEQFSLPGLNILRQASQHGFEPPRVRIVGQRKPAVGRLANRHAHGAARTPGATRFGQRSPSGSVSDAMGLSRSASLAEHGYGRGQPLKVRERQRFVGHLTLARRVLNPVATWPVDCELGDVGRQCLTDAEFPHQLAHRQERSTRLIGLGIAGLPLNNAKDIFKAHVTRHHDVYDSIFTKGAEFYPDW